MSTVREPGSTVTDRRFKTSHNRTSQTVTTNPSNLPGTQVELLMDGNFNIWLHSYFVTGLIQLAQEGTIALRIVRDKARTHRAMLPSNDYPLLTLTCTGATGGSARTICFDPRDQSDAWQSPALDECDIYFKRSTHSPDTERLPQSHLDKVRPINPMFATWLPTPGGWTTRMYTAFAGTAVRNIMAGCLVRSAIQSLQREVYALASLSSLAQYEDTPTGAKQNQVLFQTRLWDPVEEDGDWVEPCNQERVQMVRVLRARLGDRLVGGLIRTPYTEQHHPDLLSNLTPNSKAKRPEFIRLCRQFLVRVNIKALFDAIPYSLGETLAANNCLVSQEIRNTCATPLVEGRHYVGFTTPAECAERCLELLDSSEKAKQLREEAHAYYLAAVRPREAMRTFLEQAMS